MEKFPLEVLIKTFKNLAERDVRQCLLVNKFWSKGARLFIGKAIRVLLNEKSTLYQDLLRFPLLASRVELLIIQSNDTAYCILTLSLCPNILMLSFYECRPAKLLERLLECEYDLLPKIQEVRAGPGNYNETNILWPFIWKHRSTIRSLNCYGETYECVGDNYEDIYGFVAQFPQLEVFEGLGFYDMNLYKLLSSAKNLRVIMLNKSWVHYDNEGNEDAIVPANLQYFHISVGEIRESAIDFLADVSVHNVKRFTVHGKSMIDVGQDVEEKVNDFLERYPDVPEKHWPNYIEWVAFD